MFTQKRDKLLVLFLLAQKKATQFAWLLYHFVIPLGLEPRTHTLKVYCSTN